MRHGEVRYFDDDGRPFRPNEVPLDPEGRTQAEAAARMLADVPFDRAVSSDLPRSVETATVVLGGRTVRLETRPELRELQPGRLADLQEGDLEAAFLGAFDLNVGPESRFLGGETFGSLCERVRACYQEVLADPAWRNLLIVAHGGVNRVLLCDALKLGLAGFGGFEQDAACVNVLDVMDGGRCLLRLVNHTPYNAAKTGLELTTMERLYAGYRARRNR
jgi:phosphoserine phosphatase